MAELGLIVCADVRSTRPVHRNALSVVDVRKDAVRGRRATDFVRRATRLVLGVWSSPLRPKIDARPPTPTPPQSGSRD